MKQHVKQHYRVSFFKKLTDSTGHPFDVPRGWLKSAAIGNLARSKAGLRFAGRSTLQFGRCALTTREWSFSTGASEPRM